MGDIDITGCHPLVAAYYQTQRNKAMQDRSGILQRPGVRVSVRRRDLPAATVVILEIPARGVGAPRAVFVWLGRATDIGLSVRRHKRIFARAKATRLGWDWWITIWWDRWMTIRCDEWITTM